jgi:transposase
MREGLRPSVIFRKVTGCFRSAWGAKAYADAQSLIATGCLHGKTALQSLHDTITPLQHNPGRLCLKAPSKY